MSFRSRLERMERACVGESPREVEHIVVDAGDGYRIEVDVPAGTLAQLAKVYGEEGEGCAYKPESRG